MRLYSNLATTWSGPSFVARITTRADLPRPLRPSHALIAEERSNDGGFALHLLRGSLNRDAGEGWIGLPPELGYLTDGDVVRVVPSTAAISVLYRRNSEHNCLVPITRCNCACIMCSQPPVGDDPDIRRDLLAAIPLIDPRTKALGISGGEPTLWGDHLVELVQRIRNHLPDTRIDLLTNGRLFKYARFAKRLATAGAPNLCIGVPVHSDLPDVHDEIAGSPGCFDDTILGLLNLRRCGVPVEVRVVLHKRSIQRLHQLADFIARNLCFAAHVALMGLEAVGRAEARRTELEVQPREFSDELRAAVLRLQAAGLEVSLYNLPLCLIPADCWPIARQSISDWKNVFPPACSECDVRTKCSGLFARGNEHLLDALRPMRLPRE